MGLFEWLKPSKTSIQDAVRSGNLPAVRAAIKRGVTKDELDTCILFAVRAGLAMVQLIH